MKFHLTNLKQINKLLKFKTSAALDARQLHFLYRQLAADGKLKEIDAVQRSDIFSLLERSDSGEVLPGDHLKILDNMSALSSLVTQDKLAASPIYKSSDSSWTFTHILVITSAFLSLIALILLSSVHNKSRLSYDRIAALLVDKDSLAAAKTNSAAKSDDKADVEKLLYLQNVTAETQVAAAMLNSDQRAIKFIIWLVDGSYASGPDKLERAARISASRQSSVSPQEFAATETLKEKFFPSVIPDINVPVKPSFSDANVLALTLFLRTLEQMIYVLSAFLLPICYGVLGAAVFMMRELLPTKSNILKIHVSLEHAALRIGMGAVTGIIVGWFSISSKISEMTSTPFAVAFLAGFSFDLVFTFLDKLMAAFSSPSAGAK